MEHFSFGWVTLLFILITPAVYMFGRQVRRLGAWVQREEGPKERVGAMIIIFAFIGLLAGSAAQPIWDKGSQCKAARKPVLSCVFFSR